MKKSLIAGTSAVALLVGATLPAFAGAAHAAPANKVTVCHATHSDSNPYVLISVRADKAHGHVHQSPHGSAPGEHEPDLRPAGVEGAEDCGENGPPPRPV